MYDDAALARLLDRSDLTSQSDLVCDDGALMASFKVANFDVINSSGKDFEDDINASKSDGAPQTQDPDFWENLLKDRFDNLVEQPDATTALESNRRRGRRINYCLDADVGEDPSSDYHMDGLSHASTSPLGDNKRRTVNNKRKESESVKGSEASKRARIQPQANLAPAQEAGSGSNLVIHGYSLKDRQSFLNCLMRHGLPANFRDSESSGDWGAFTARLPQKRLKDICRYARTVLEAAGGKPEDGINPKVGDPTLVHVPQLGSFHVMCCIGIGLRVDLVDRMSCWTPSLKICSPVLEQYICSEPSWHSQDIETQKLFLFKTQTQSCSLPGESIRFIRILQYCH